MKFLPIPSFDNINSVLSGVESQFGYALTIKLEAYSARKTKDERKLEQAIATNQQQQQQQQHMQQQHPHPHEAQPGEGYMGELLEEEDADFLLDMEAAASSSSLVDQQFPSTPPSLTAAAPQPFGNIPQTAEVSLPASFAASGLGHGTEQQPQQQQQQRSPKPDHRFVALIGALNAVHNDEYDFSVLDESAFVRYHPNQLLSDLNALLYSLPHVPCTPDVFWRCIGEQCSLADSEFYLFDAPEYNPLSQRFIFANHFFIYCKKNKIIISLLTYGASNLYRGDDMTLHGVFGGSDVYGGRGGGNISSDAAATRRKAEGKNDDDGEEYYLEEEDDDGTAMMAGGGDGLHSMSGTGKNQGYYGFGGYSVGN